jgi:hypothetical protein
MDVHASPDELLDYRAYYGLTNKGLFCKPFSPAYRFEKNCQSRVVLDAENPRSCATRCEGKRVRKWARYIPAGGE